MSKITVSREATYAYSSGTGAVYRTPGAMGAASGGGKASAGSQAAAEPTNPEKRTVGGFDYVPWGDDNLFPQAVIKDIEKSTMLPAIFEKKTDTMYGGGLMYGTITGVDKDNNLVFKRGYDLAIEAWMQGTALNRYAYEALHDVNTFSNAFPELILSKDRNAIVGISAQEACWCRYRKPKNGQLTDVYINANWDNGGNPEDIYTTTVPVIDPYYNAVDALRGRSGFKFIYPISVPSSDKSMYQLASWNSVRRSGWLEVAAAIPEFKKMLFQNQLSVKYIITVHSAYWEWKYGDWDALTRDEKKTLLEAEIKAFDDVMSGTNGAGKTVMTTTITDKKTGLEVAAFTIEAIDDKLKDGIYIEDSQEASSHIFTATGFAPSLMGISPGKGMGGGAGGGSEPRVLFSNFVSTAQFKLDLVLEPLNFASRYNGQTIDGQPVVWRFVNPYVMTEAAAKTPSAPAQQETK
ncbi:hypothetical protein [Hymenobacter terricola]|uniref:hypothetical protein n=1 Tax=Hymenobacter terricola TaxID=2819236 RepID=UPI001B310162|nr:hypothetical protein [Hymenobacter terricola]